MRSVLTFWGALILGAAIAAGSAYAGFQAGHKLGYIQGFSKRILRPFAPGEQLPEPSKPDRGAPAPTGDPLDITYEDAIAEIGPLLEP